MLTGLSNFLQFPQFPFLCPARLPGIRQWHFHQIKININMKNLLLAAFSLLAMAACQNSGTADKEAAAADTTATAVPAETAQSDTSTFVPQACFIWAEGQDTTWIGIAMLAGNTIRGTYDWVPWEKDGAHGTFSGTRDKELIHVIYDYVIEGSSQKEEKIFKMAGSGLEEGEGELQDSPDGVLRLKDPAKVTFKPLTRVPCKR